MSGFTLQPLTFHLHFYLYYCNQLPALNYFCCKYLKQFLFLCLDADWWIKIGISFILIRSINLPSLKDRGWWSSGLNSGLISPEAYEVSPTLACVLLIGAAWTKSNISCLIHSHSGRRKLLPSPSPRFPQMKFFSLQLLLIRKNFEFPLISWLRLLDSCFLNFNVKITIQDDSGDSFRFTCNCRK